MTVKNLPEENIFQGYNIKDYVLNDEIGRGKIGVVYKAHHQDIEKLIAAIKIIPKTNLKNGWEIELEKVGLLDGIPQVVQYKDHIPKLIDNVLYVCIFWEYVNGKNLEKYAEKNPKRITLPFIEHLINEILTVFVAMNNREISHGDLHAGNILIAYDDRLPNPENPVIKVSDFGIGGSRNKLDPKDDYAQLSLICHNLLKNYIDPSKLDGKDKYIFDALVEDFLPKKLLETNKTVGDFVREPRKLLMHFEEIRLNYKRDIQPTATLLLKNPFDYLSCEEMGDSFDLLQRLYSKNFPGYDALTQRTNTILTGPRGCGKTTIFRNLSLKTQLLGRKRSIDDLDSYIGIYYHCSDLYFAFPYSKKKITEKDRRIIITFFNLAIFYEILDTLIVVQDTLSETETPYNELQKYLRKYIASYNQPPLGTSVLSHLKSFITAKKEEIKSWVVNREKESYPETFLPLDFIKNICQILQNTLLWLKGKAIYFFLDDYSLPRISEPIQATLHDFILNRYSECFFKISTESITTFHPYDSNGKLIEETREYDVIDLGAQFLHSSKEAKDSFLIGVINSRLQNTSGIHEDYQDIRKLLGTCKRSYNQLAREIRGNHRTHYYGWDMVVDLCSGDVVNILRLIRDIILLIGGMENLYAAGKVKLPLDEESKISRKNGIQIQDQAIREIGNDFLNRVQSIPNIGRELRKITASFGKVANWYLCHRNSSNVKQNPPWQAFRLEVRDTPYFNKLDVVRNKYELDEKLTPEKLKELYRGLIRYGIFLRDVRGKSQRGAVIPRLYLRRLLLPTFLLTPNKRDSIPAEVGEFFMLLSDPDRFIKHMTSKEPKKPKKKKTKHQKDNQGNLFDE